ncbi:MAG: hypothetical protein C4K58_07015 [Flavobacteriaceae bacterium]|nr:MAG: hypothetical protein C4K58_07015 [Flavobacteriaceae bacterium]
MEKSNQNKIFKSIFFLILMSVFQPFFDIFLLFQYGPSATSIESFILEQTITISLLYLALPLIVLYLFIKKSKLNSRTGYILIGFLFSIISFCKITLFLFTDRIAAWSTFSKEEVFNNALYMAVPTLFMQSVVIFKILYKNNVIEN